MFVVADEGARGIGRKRRLAGSRKAEEQSRIAVRANIGRAVHGHDALRRQNIIQEAEHRFFHFAGIARAADENDLAGQVDRYDCFAAAAVPLRIGLERRQIDDCHLRLEGGEFVRRGANEQVTNEKRVPSIFGEDPDIDPMRRVGAAVKVLNEQALAPRMRNEVGAQAVELRPAQGIRIVPPDGVFRVGVPDNEFVHGGSAGVNTGLGNESSAFGDLRLVALERFMVKMRRIQIVEDVLLCFETKCLRAESRIEQTDFLHNSSPSRHSGTVDRALCNVRI